MATPAALLNDFWSSVITLLDICCCWAAGIPDICLLNDFAYPAVNRAPKIDVMIAPPKSLCKSAVPDAIPSLLTGTEPVNECEAGVPANPTPIPIKAYAKPIFQ